MLMRKPRSPTKQWLLLPGHRRPFSSTCPAFGDDSASSWKISIRSLVHSGRFRDALRAYTRPSGPGLRPDTFAVAVALKACARVSSRALGASIHSQVCKYGYGSDVYAATALVDFYSKMDGVGAAQRAFDEMPVKNVVSWNSILSAYLKAGELGEARRVFDGMPVRDVVSWNSLVAGYAKTGDMDRAFSIFQDMPERNPASWNGMIGGYLDKGDVESARGLFDKMPEKSSVSWVLMISGYSQCGDFISARCIFDRMMERDRYSWNAMIASYAQSGRAREALELFNRMRKLGVGGELLPDEMTFSSVVSACAQLGNLRYGMWVEKYMRYVGIELDDHLRTALVDLYAKCGSLDKAFELFTGLKRRDLVSYSSMILGFGINGRATNAVDLFDEMLKDEISPNAVTFLGLLTAYSHAGLVEEGCKCFFSMWNEHCIAPSAEHYAIMVDLLGRDGQLDEAYELIRSMPMKPHVGAWGALLLACRLHGNIQLGEVAAQNCFELEPEASGYYVLLANIYAEAGKWNEAKRLRSVMAKKGFSLTPGCSWVEPG